MSIINILHMNHGDGEKSYAMNSTIQMRFMSKTLSIVKDTINDMFANHFPSFETLESFKIADIGCASGPNTLLLVSEVIDTIYNLSNQNQNKSLEISIVLNDLHKNDFNNIFRALPSFYDRLKEKHGYEFSQKCFISGVASSFYERLLPCKSLHFVHSSSSLHWLSQVPNNLENKGHIYMARDCLPNVFEAYKNQFYKDFSTFLNKRSHETLPSGRMILTLMGRSIPEPSSNDCCCIWELLAQSLLDVVSQGLIQKEDVDSFNLPLYTPYTDEVKEIIMKEKSFDLKKMEIFKYNWDHDDNDDKKKSGEIVANFVRAVTQPMLVTHFGELFLNNVFNRYEERVADHVLKTEKTKFIILTICLRKK
ncbi:probable jasmonic acid carboxyl methyltransferase 2 [Impatiens glandulifera]|uniref:probable jasmonic acid carboxyl methyltransferase 2 n=1 Tax=Impatiens glandulifera TaxID=253017 RepID=UPI001FB10B5C|nr:probable jasmonic acid carboxyl methyltransferase 2 [Impatiens glandulifera]